MKAERVGVLLAAYKCPSRRIGDEQEETATKENLTTLAARSIDTRKQR